MRWRRVLFSLLLFFGLATSAIQVLSQPATQDDVLSPENAVQIQQISRLGSGQFNSAVAYAPSGNQIAVGGSIGLWLYDAHRLDQAPRFIDADQTVSDVAYSSDGHYLAYATQTGVTIVDADTLQNVLEIPGAVALAFRPATHQIAVALFEYVEPSSYYPDVPIEIWDIDQGKKLLTVADDLRLGTYARRIRFSPDGQYVAAIVASFPEDTCNLYGASVKVWDLQHPTLPAQVLDDAEAFAFDPVAPIIVAAYHDAENIASGAFLYVWNYQQQTTQKLSMPAYNSQTLGYDISDIAFNRDGTQFVVMDAGQAWEWTYGQSQPEFSVSTENSDDSFIGVSANPTGDSWLMVSPDHLSIRDDQLFSTTIVELQNQFRNITLAPSGAGFLAENATGVTQIWQTANEQPTLLATTDSRFIRMRGSTVVYADSDEFHVFTLTGQRKPVTIPFDGRIVAMQLNDAGNLLAYQTQDNFVLWDIDQGYNRFNLQAALGFGDLKLSQIKSFSFLTQSEFLRFNVTDQRGQDWIYLISGTRLNSPTVWQFGGYPLTTEISYLHSTADYFFFSRSVDLGGGGGDNAITDVIQYDSQKGLGYLSSFEGGQVEALNHTTIDSTITVPDGFGLTLIDFRELPSMTSSQSLQFGGAVNAAATGHLLSPDGTRFLTFTSSVSNCGGDFNNLTLWDTGTAASLLSTGTARGSTAVFSPDSTLLAVAGQSQVSLYDARTAKLLVTLDSSGSSDIIALQFDAQGRYLMGSTQDGTVRLWSIPDKSE